MHTYCAEYQVAGSTHQRPPQQPSSCQAPPASAAAAAAENHHQQKLTAGGGGGGVASVSGCGGHLLYTLLCVAASLENQLPGTRDIINHLTTTSN